VDRVYLFEILFFFFEILVDWLQARFVDQPVFSAYEDFACGWVCECGLFVPSNGSNDNTLQ
jgi:hypothetical protein